MRMMSRIAAAGLAAAALLPADGAAASVNRHHDSDPLSGAVIAYGANSRRYAAFHRAVPLSDTSRVYWHGLNSLPRVWPTVAPHVLLSFEPDPSTLLSGSLDARLLALAATAPPGSMLVPWYEAGPANPRGYPSDVTARSVVAMEAYLHRLLRVSHHTNVQVGSIVCGPVPELTGWIAPRLDFYGADIAAAWFFRAGRFETIRLSIRLHRDAAVWHAKSPDAAVVIGETNTAHDRNRARWFTLLSTDLAAVSRRGTIISFWRTGRARQGATAGFWPPSADTIRAFRHLSFTYLAYARPW